jgi:hypothetical protein
VPDAIPSDALRDVLARWSQETRFASILAVDGLRAGDARGLVLDVSADNVLAFFKALAAVAP